MRSLYIINTPLQLLTAFIIANSYDTQSQKHLILMNPKHYHLWQNNSLLKAMVNDKETWNEIAIYQRDWLPESFNLKKIKTILKSLKSNLLKSGEIDRVYLGSDKLITNQLLVDLAGNASYIRFDEGIGSYIIPMKRAIWSKLGEWLLVQFVKQIGKGNSGLKYNFRGLGAGEVAIADYLYKPENLERDSPDVIKIERQAVQHSLKKMMPYMQPLEQLESRNILLYLGATYSHTAMIDQEVSYFQMLLQYAEKYRLHFLYKTHPREDPEKLKVYQKLMPSFEVLDCIEPIETIIYRYSSIKCILSLTSSGMLYSDLFTDYDIKRISTMKVVGCNSEILEKIMKKTGVLIPANREELEAIIADLKL